MKRLRRQQPYGIWHRNLINNAHDLAEGRDGECIVGRDAFEDAVREREDRDLTGARYYDAQRDQRVARVEPVDQVQRQELLHDCERVALQHHHQQADTELPLLVDRVVGLRALARRVRRDAVGEAEHRLTTMPDVIYFVAHGPDCRH